MVQVVRNLQNLVISFKIVMKPGKLQGSNQGAKFIVGMSTTVHNLLFCSDRIKQLKMRTKQRTLSSFIERFHSRDQRTYWFIETKDDVCIEIVFLNSIKILFKNYIKILLKFPEE